MMLDAYSEQYILYNAKDTQCMWNSWNTQCNAWSTMVHNAYGVICKWFMYQDAYYSFDASKL